MKLSPFARIRSLGRKGFLGFVKPVGRSAFTGTVAQHLGGLDIDWLIAPVVTGALYLWLTLAASERRSGSVGGSFAKVGSERFNWSTNEASRPFVAAPLCGVKGLK